MITPTITELKQEILAVGLSARVTPKDIFQKLPKLYQKYLQNKPLIKHLKTPWDYVSLSSDFDENNTFSYLTGHVVTSHEEQPDFMEKFIVPQGLYAVFSIKCKFGFLFGFKMGQMKRYIYQKWLPTSIYEFSGIEFEYNNEEMHKSSPYNIDLYIGIKPKN